MIPTLLDAADELDLRPTPQALALLALASLERMAAPTWGLAYRVFLGLVEAFAGLKARREVVDMIRPLEHAGPTVDRLGALAVLVSTTAETYARPAPGIVEPLGRLAAKLRASAYREPVVSAVAGEGAS